MLATANLTKQVQVPGCLLSKYMDKSNGVGWSSMFCKAKRMVLSKSWFMQRCSVISISEGVQALETWKEVSQGGGTGL